MFNGYAVDEFLVARGYRPSRSRRRRSDSSRRCSRCSGSSWNAHNTPRSNECKAICGRGRPVCSLHRSGEGDCLRCEVEEPEAIKLVQLGVHEALGIRVYVLETGVLISAVRLPLPPR
jgi:hypothetical protein